MHHCSHTSSSSHQASKAKGKGMAMARRSSRSMVGMLLLLLLVVVGASKAEQLVAMMHPAPSTLGLTGFGSSLAASTQYYISYGSLDANRAPCPAGTGRSYYTQNCQGSGAVQPYVRSCNAITRCQRG